MSSLTAGDLVAWAREALRPGAVTGGDAANGGELDGEDGGENESFDHVFGFLYSLSAISLRKLA